MIGLSDTPKDTHTYVPVVIATHPYQTWFEPVSPRLRCVWKEWVLVGATIWHYLLDNFVVHPRWFPDATKMGSDPIDFWRLSGILAWLHQEFQYNRNTREFFDDLVREFRREMYRPQEGKFVPSGISLGSWEALNDWLAQLPSNLPEPYCIGDVRPELLWLVLSTLPPRLSSAQKNRRVCVMRAKAAHDPVELVFYWSGNGQSAWGIETGHYTAATMLGSAICFFPVLEGKLILPFVPGRNYVSSLFEIGFEDEPDEKMPVWLVISQLGLACHCSVDRVAQGLHETLLRPDVRKNVQNGEGRKNVLITDRQLTAANGQLL